MKRNETKRNEMKRNETKPNETKLCFRFVSVRFNFVLIAFYSCSNGFELSTVMTAEAEAERTAVAQSNLEAGRAYMEDLSAKGEVQTTESGLQYIALETGEGESPVAADSVEVHYEGRLIDGTVFDSSFERGQTVTFGLTQVIPGWTEGLQLMKPGAKFKFIIPPELGYGEGGAGQMIGPNATLLFDVELIAVVPSEEP